LAADGEDYIFPYGCQPTGKIHISPDGVPPTGKVSVTEKKNPTLKTFPDGSNRQGSIRDGFPSGKVDFSSQFIPDGVSLTVTITELFS
jgi:hypothetical protein